MARAEVLTWGAVPGPQSYAYGYAQARDHGAMLMRFIGVSRGRAAEYWGSNYTASDVYVWSSRIPQYTDELYLQQDPESVINCVAFAAGFNKYMEDHPEDHVNEQWGVVLPISGWDVFANSLRVYYIFSYGGSSGITADFLEQNPGPDSFREKHASSTRHYSAYTDYSQPFEDVPKELRHLLGSNGWAIGAPKTASGSTMLNMNPHLPYVSFFHWYEAHFVVASDDLDVRAPLFASCGRRPALTRCGARPLGSSTARALWARRTCRSPSTTLSAGRTPST